MNTKIPKEVCFKVSHNNQTKEIFINLENILKTSLHNQFTETEELTMNVLDRIKLRALSAFDLVSSKELNETNLEYAYKKFDLICEKMPNNLSTVNGLVKSFMSAKHNKESLITSFSDKLNKTNNNKELKNISDKIIGNAVNLNLSERLLDKDNTQIHNISKSSDINNNCLISGVSEDQLLKKASSLRMRKSVKEENSELLLDNIFNNIKDSYKNNSSNIEFDEKDCMVFPLNLKLAQQELNEMDNINNDNNHNNEKNDNIYNDDSNINIYNANISKSNNYGNNRKILSKNNRLNQDSSNSNKIVNENSKMKSRYYRNNTITYNNNKKLDKLIELKCVNTPVVVKEESEIKKEEIQNLKSSILISIPEETNKSLNIFNNFLKSYLILKNDMTAVKDKYLNFTENTCPVSELVILVKNKSNKEIEHIKFKVFINNCILTSIPNKETNIPFNCEYCNYQLEKLKKETVNNDNENDNDNNNESNTKIKAQTLLSLENLSSTFNFSSKDKEYNLFDDDNQIHFFIKPRETKLLKIPIQSALIEHIYKLELRVYDHELAFYSEKKDSENNSYFEIGEIDLKVNYIKNNLSALYSNYKNIIFSILNELNSYFNLNLNLVYYLYLFFIFIMIIILSISKLAQSFVNHDLEQNFLVGQIIWIVICFFISLSKEYSNRVFAFLFFIASSSFIIMSLIFNVYESFNQLKDNYIQQNYFSLIWMITFYLLNLFISYLAFCRVLV